MKFEKEEKKNETKGMLYEAYLNRGLRFDRRKRRASKMELLTLSIPKMVKDSSFTEVPANNLQN
ncbi:hypothetical protein J8281_06310 [Aquimarina sp. U1-2]|uniref:hypothetical protein n=1 Tax=Aquimarina sp. U1-2 TaxID=2823141 RepID=UPI001AECEC19|nr:hypothetical protein [Aquimarina sp. U1-2]MBP2831797.1 hypothetical protein [Aquimarina sp. U1-2]